jgi:hypothetical protein
MPQTSHGFGKGGNASFVNKGYVDDRFDGFVSGIPEAPIDGEVYGRQNAAWTNVFPYVLKTGDTMTGPLSFTGPSGTNRSIFGRTDGMLRWEMDLGDATPDVANAGSNFVLYSYNDAGVASPALTITRATGQATFISHIIANGVANILGGIVHIRDSVGAQIGPFLNMLSYGTIGSIISGRFIDTQAGWQILMPNDTARIGANAGADFDIRPLDDAGLNLPIALHIERATGNVTFTSQIIQNMPTANMIVGQKNGITRATVSIGDPSYVFNVSAYDTAGNISIPYALAVENTAVSTYTGTIGILPRPNNPGNVQLAFYANTPNSIARVTSITSNGGGWTILMPNDTPATGGNVGGDFSIQGQNDVSATPIFPIPFSIRRSDGLVTIPNLAGYLSLIDPIVVNAPYLPLIGGVLTGPLTLSGLPTQLEYAANKQYVDDKDAVLQAAIDLLASNLLFIGTIDVPNDIGNYTTASAIPPGALPAPDTTNSNFYVIVAVGGAPPAGNIPIDTYNTGDWIVSNGTQWIKIPTGQPNLIASEVAITPPIGALGANVQTGLEWLNANHLPLTGGTLAGPGHLDVNGHIWCYSGNLQLVDPSTSVVSYYLAGSTGVSISGTYINSAGWQIYMPNTTPLTGANAGADFDIIPYSDTGAALPNALNIRRSDRMVTLSGALTVNGTGTVGISIQAPGQIFGGSFRSSGDIRSEAPQASFTLNKLTATNSNLIRGSSVGLPNIRWDLVLGDGSPEIGANAGSNFVITPHADDGSNLPAALSINRANGAVTIPNLGGYLPLIGGRLTGNLFITTAQPTLLLDGTIGSTIRLDNPAGGRSYIYSSVTGLTRWAINLKDTTPETGGNAGANFSITCAPDNGVAILFTPLSIVRSTGVVTIPNIAPPTQPTNPTTKQYVDDGDAALQAAIDLLASNLLFIGVMDVPADNGNYTAASGIQPGELPAPVGANSNMYVIVSVGGNPPGGSNIPVDAYNIGDWIVSTGTQWLRLPTGQAATIAAEVAITPPTGALGPNVQTALDWLDTNKVDLTDPVVTTPYLPLTGGTLSGDLIVDGAATFAPGVLINGAVGSSRNILGQTGGQNRWAIELGTSTDETGANAGSNFALVRYSDAGAVLGNVLTFNRSTGQAAFNGTVFSFTSSATFSGPISANGGLSSTNITSGLLFLTGAPVNSAMRMDGVDSATSTIYSTTVGLNRWWIRLKDGTVEAGANAGSNFDIRAYADDGIAFITPLTINRATGLVTIPNLAGYLPLTGGGITGNVFATGFFSAPSLYAQNTVGNAVVQMVSTAGGGGACQIFGQNSGAGGVRWQLILKSNTPELGGNVGSDFQLVRYDDNGNIIDTLLTIGRATALATFTGGGTFRGPMVVQPLTAAASLQVSSQVAGASITLNSVTASLSEIIGFNGTAGITGTRWRMRLKDQAPETGGNTGSNFAIFPVGDDGVPYATPALSINRATGTVEIPSLTVGGVPVTAAMINDLITRIAQLEARIA